MFKTKVKNGIMGTFHFDKNGDTFPFKWISFDRCLGPTRANTRSSSSPRSRDRGEIAREHMTLGKGPRGPSPADLGGQDRERDTGANVSHVSAVGRPRRTSFPRVGLTLVALVIAWLIVNLVQDWSLFFRVFLIGLTNGALYALVALGYTLVYGILELINFAHGDVFMIGGMIAATVALQMFGLSESSGLGTLIPSILVALLIAMAGCAFLNATIERDRVQAPSARSTARAADHGDRGVVHPRGRRLDLEGLAANRDAGNAEV